MSPFLERMRKKNSRVIEKNINLGYFKDLLIQHLIAVRAISGEIVDIDFGLPSKGCVPLKIYVKSTEVDVNKEDAEDQVGTKQVGKKRP